MHGPKSSLARAWYRLTTRRRLARNEWSAPYWEERGGERIVACRRCPKFDAREAECGVPFGSPLRKCVVAATEAHLRATRGLRVLELGYARRSYGKRIVELAGGSWTGVEPLVDRNRPPQLGSGGYGHAGDIPFPDARSTSCSAISRSSTGKSRCPTARRRRPYAACLAEIWRVLRPGGSLYLDAPIHLHGHEMFVAGDVARIVALFAAELLDGRDRRALALRPCAVAALSDAGRRHRLRARHDQELRLGRIADLQTNGTVWLLTVTAVEASGRSRRDRSPRRRAASVRLRYATTVSRRQLATARTGGRRSSPLRRWRGSASRAASRGDDAARRAAHGGVSLRAARLSQLAVQPRGDYGAAAAARGPRTTPTPSSTSCRASAASRASTPPRSTSTATAAG